MTKLAICIFLYLAITCIILIAHAGEQKYSNKYDNINVNAVLANPRLRNQYVQCVIGTSPCRTGSERFLKENFAEAYITNCKKCTEKQVVFFDTITSWFTKNEPDTWERVVRMILDDLRKKNA